jgi:hypothetical protein
MVSTAATSNDFSAFVLADLDVAEDFVVLLLGSLRTDHDFSIQRVAAFDLR